MNEKIYQYYVHTISGLEEVVVEDVRQCLKQVENVSFERGQRQGRVLFKYQRSPRRLVELRSAVSTYGLLADIRGITVGQPGLKKVCQALERLPLEAARSLVRACDASVDTDAFRLSATVKGSHRFDGRELTAAAADVLQSHCGLTPAGQGRALHLQIRVTGTRAVVGVQVGERREPGSPRRDGAGAPLAYCMARLMGLEEGDRVVAAGCSPAGAAEIAAVTGASVMALGWQRPVPPATPAAGRLGALQGSAGELPLGDGQATAGLAVIAEGAADRSGAGFEVVPELARAVAPGGVLALLVAEPRIFIPLLQAAGLPLEILTGLPIGVGGRAYGLYLLERTDLALLQL